MKEYRLPSGKVVKTDRLDQDMAVTPLVVAGEHIGYVRGDGMVALFRLPLEKQEGIIRELQTDFHELLMASTELHDDVEGFVVALEKSGYDRKWPALLADLRRHLKAVQAVIHPR